MSKSTATTILLPYLTLLFWLSSSSKSASSSVIQNHHLSTLSPLLKCETDNSLCGNAEINHHSTASSTASITHCACHVCTKSVDADNFITSHLKFAHVDTCQLRYCLSFPIDLFFNFSNNSSPKQQIIVLESLIFSNITENAACNWNSVFQVLPSSNASDSSNVTAIKKLVFDNCEILQSSRSSIKFAGKLFDNGVTLEFVNMHNITTLGANAIDIESTPASDARNSIIFRNTTLRTISPQAFGAFQNRQIDSIVFAENKHLGTTATAGDIFTALAAFSSINILNLTANRIASINVKSAPLCIIGALDLSRNEINAINATAPVIWQSMKNNNCTFDRLDLSYNKITVVDDDVDFSNVRSGIDLSHNELRNCPKSLDCSVSICSAAFVHYAYNKLSTPCFQQHRLTTDDNSNNNDMFTANSFDCTDESNMQNYICSLIDAHQQQHNIDKMVKFINCSANNADGNVLVPISSLLKYYSSGACNRTAAAALDDNGINWRHDDDTELLQLSVMGLYNNNSNTTTTTTESPEDSAFDGLAYPVYLIACAIIVVLLLVFAYFAATNENRLWQRRIDAAARGGNGRRAVVGIGPNNIVVHQTHDDTIAVHDPPPKYDQVVRETPPPLYSSLLDRFVGLRDSNRSYNSTRNSRHSSGGGISNNNYNDNGGSDGVSPHTSPRQQRQQRQRHATTNIMQQLPPHGSEFAMEIISSQHQHQRTTSK